MISISADSHLGESSLEEYVHRVSDLPVYDLEEERRLFRAARAGDESARDALVAAHLRLVIDLALERRGWGVPLVGLIRAGNRGLARAAEEFEPDGPGGERRFLRFAVPWIRQEMLEVLEVA